MTTTRSVRLQISEILDYLVEAELVLNVNAVVASGSRVSWATSTTASSFLLSRNGETISQYLSWLEASNYTALLFDGSLLQITYDVTGGVVSGHRLAYVPCPVPLEAELIEAGFSISDIVRESIQHQPTAVRMRTPIRFDYDPEVASKLHPSAHLSLNEPGCRVPCIAPVHVGRFVDFVFRHFLHDLWAAHKSFFDAVSSRSAGPANIANDHRLAIHVAWT